MRVVSGSGSPTHDELGNTSGDRSRIAGYLISARNGLTKGLGHGHPADSAARPHTRRARIRHSRPVVDRARGLGHMAARLRGPDGRGRLAGPLVPLVTVSGQYARLRIPAAA